MNTWVEGLFQTTSLLSQGRGNAADIPASPDPTCGITPGMLLLESLWEDKGLGVIFPFIYFVIMVDYYTLCVVYYYINMLPFRTKKLGWDTEFIGGTLMSLTLFLWGSLYVKLELELANWIKIVKVTAVENTLFLVE